MGGLPLAFFNIDTDMLLLEHYFLFAKEFSNYISEMAKGKAKGSNIMIWKVYHIEKRTAIGNLMVLFTE